MQIADFNSGWTFMREGGEPLPVTLPHDAMIHERRDPDSPGGSADGYFPGGRYVYRKEFAVGPDLTGKFAQLRFGGVYRDAIILLDGACIDTHHYGYTPFICDLSKHLSAGTHVLEVRVDNSHLPDSRWYSGSGIYRGVQLLTSGPDHIPYDGLQAKTLSLDPARVQVICAVEGEGDVHIELVDQDGKTVASTDGRDAELEVPDAHLWSADDPFLYTVRATLSRDGAVVDTVHARFGIRTLAWSAREGFLVNGESVLLRGGCIHHDNGLLGAATYAESEQRRVRIMRETGFNAIRSAHNPASDELLDACDRLGMYVIDETFDMWYQHKNRYDYARDFETDWKQDVAAMVRRDINHPCVLMYSIGNEVSEPAKPRGLQTEQAMIDLVHDLDDTRPVTAGFNLSIIANAARGKEMYDGENDPGVRQKAGEKDGASKQEGNASLLFNTVASMVGTGMNKAANSDRADAATTPGLDLLDIAGYNYASGRYPLEGRKHPERVIFGSETFPQDICKNWRMVRSYPYLIGDFMWTGWDYLGEAGLGAWSYTGGVPFNRPYPWLLSGAGVIDILGNPDASAKYAKVVWGLEKKPVIGVRPPNHPGKRPGKSVWRGTNAIESWSWLGCDGNKTLAEVFVDADEVELLINGKSQGRKRVRDCVARFKVRYEPGTIEALSFRQGDPCGYRSLSSATGAIHVTLAPEVEEARPGQVVYVPVTLEGENGIVESNADDELVCTVKGCQLLGFGSANPCTEQCYDSGRFSSYQGRALAIVRMGEGPARISVSSTHCGCASVTIPLT